MANCPELVPVSTYESEYLAAFKTCLRIEATVQFLKELAHVLGSPHIGPVLLREDNMSNIKLTEAPDIPKRSRHINVKYHKVRYMAVVIFSITIRSRVP